MEELELLDRTTKQTYMENILLDVRSGLDVLDTDEDLEEFLEIVANGSATELILFLTGTDSMTTFLPEEEEDDEARDL